MKWNTFIVRKVFGVELAEKFVEFQEEPLGSGSAAQVHLARLREDQKVVAVKILHPGVEELFNTDLLLLSAIANIAHRIPSFSWLHLPEELGYFAKCLRQQLDLRYEAYTLSRFRRNFLTDMHVTFPTPFESSRDILIESFEEGLPISFFSRNHPKHVDNLAAWDEIKRRISGLGLKAFLQMILWDNFVHADLHPGNMFVAFSNVEAKSIKSADDAAQAYASGHALKIVFLDTGLVTELSKRDYTNFTDLFKSLVFKNDGRLAAKLIIDRGPCRFDPDHIVHPDEFCNEVGRLVDSIFADKSSALAQLSHFSFSPIIFRMFELVRSHHVRLEGAFTNLIMSLVCLEGFGKELCPELSLRPYLLSAGFQYLATNLAQTVAGAVDPYI